MAKRILVVEDDSVMQSFVRNALKPDEYEIICTDDGNDAIALQETEQFDCIITDFYLPGKNGFGIIDAMRRRQDSTPAIVMSGSMSELYESAVKGLGVTCRVLRKPFSVDALRRMVKEVLQQNQARRETARDILRQESNVKEVPVKDIAQRDGAGTEVTEVRIQSDCTKRGAVLFSLP